MNEWRYSPLPLYILLAEQGELYQKVLVKCLDGVRTHVIYGICTVYSLIRVRFCETEKCEDVLACLEVTGTVNLIQVLYC